MCRTQVSLGPPGGSATGAGSALAGSRPVDGGRGVSLPYGISGGSGRLAPGHAEAEAQGDDVCDGNGSASHDEQRRDYAKSPSRTVTASHLRDAGVLPHDGRRPGTRPLTWARNEHHPTFEGPSCIPQFRPSLPSSRRRDRRGLCDAPRGRPAAEGPPLLRLAAAPSSPEPSGPDDEAPPPHLAIASFAKVPGSPSDGVASAQPACPSAWSSSTASTARTFARSASSGRILRSNQLARCARFGPSECVGERVHKRFCVDRDEYVAAGADLPASDVSWTAARAICQKQDKRLCMETEWEFACEGEQMLPYPTGYDRDPKLCNFDQGPLLDHEGQAARPARAARPSATRARAPSACAT